MKSFGNSSKVLVKFSRDRIETKEEKRSLAIVDDNRDICVTISKLVEHLGFNKSIIAHDGKEIVREVVCNGRSPAVILMDYRLPLMNGLEAAERISQVRPDIKIILATSDESVKSKAESAGFGFLKKPFSLEALVRAIH